MAKTVSDEELQLRKRARRRLIGAVALVVAAIVILPMLLDSKPEERSQEIDIRIPSEDSVEELGTGATDRTGTTEAAAVENFPGGAPQPEQPAAESPVKPIPSTASAAKPAEKNADTTGGSEGAKSATTATATSKAADLFVVQLGAYSNPAKAKQQLRNLVSRKSSEYLGPTDNTEARAYTETIKVNKDAEKDTEKGTEKGVERDAERGEITRVRVGPFRTREQAEAAREKLKKLGFEGVVSDK
jgi:DedD protein